MSSEAPTDVIILEQGNGFPSEGDYVTDGGDIYRVISAGSTIHAPPALSPHSDCYIYASVVAADWDDCPEGQEHSARVEVQQ